MPIKAFIAIVCLELSAKLAVQPYSYQRNCFQNCHTTILGLTPPHQKKEKKTTLHSTTTTTSTSFIGGYVDYINVNCSR